MGTAPLLRVRLFGQPQFEVGDTQVAFRGPARALSLFAYLLLHRDRVHARPALAFLLWPDLPEPDARANLREYLRQVRNALPSADGVPWIVADARTLQWNPAAPAWLDVAEFERLAAAPATAAQAIELYSGDLASSVDDEWLEAPRERLRDIQSGLLAQLVSSTREQTDLPRAAGYAERLLRHDPWREDGIRALIELRNEMGDRAGALHVYREFAERLRKEMDVDPMPETTRVFDRVRLASEMRSNLPPALTSFVGRDEEMTAIRAALSERRFVTLLGTGGVGKTRLAVETARTLTGRFGDGVWFVDLAPVSDPALIVSAIAGAIGLQAATRASLLAAFEDNHALLVLDNCEHLIEGAAAVVEELLRVRGNVHILATSREPLRVAGERTERIATLATAPAVRLFFDRVLDVAPADWFREDVESDRQALDAIAQQLDGIPLAIEFAAARAGGLSIEALAQRLDDRFALLTAGKRTSLPRQQTLRATLDWSYDLLTSVEQRVLRAVGIFVGGWTQEAALAVCIGLGLPQASVAGALGSLAEKSLVIGERRASRTRYRLLETTRAYALEHLHNLGEFAQVRQLHADYFYTLAERIDATWQYAETAARTPAERSSELKFDLDNWRVLLAWAIEGGNDPAFGARLIGSLRWLFATLALYAEGIRWCESALRALGDDPLPADEGVVQLSIAAMMGTHPFYQRFYPDGRIDRFLAASIRATELYQAQHDSARLGLALSLRAMYLRLSDRRAEADTVASEAMAVSGSSEKRLPLPMALYAKSFTVEPSAIEERTKLLSEALRLARGFRSPYSTAQILLALGELSFEAGDAVRALIYARESRAAIDFMSSLANLAQLEINIASYSLALGEIAEARAAAANALAIGRRTGLPLIVARTLQLFAGIGAEDGDRHRSARLLGSADARIASGQPRTLTEQSDYNRTLRHLRAALTQDELASLMKEGANWSIALAVEETANV